MKVGMIYKWSWYLFLTIILLQNTKGQENKDSLYESAIMSVYDNPDRAIEIGKQIFNDNKSNPEKQIRALLLLSNAYASKRDYEKSLEYALQTNEINKKLDKPKLKLEILNKIASQYHQLGVNEKAIEVLDEADLIAKNYKDKDSIWFIMGNNYAIRGFIYKEQLSCEIAIDYLNRAYNSYLKEPQGVRTWANRSVTSYNKGNCFIMLNQLDSAKNSFRDSKQLAEKSKAKSLQAFSQKGLAEVYTLEGRYPEAITELQNALSLAKDVGDLVLNQGIYKGLSVNYLALKDWANYHFYEKEYLKNERQTQLNERKTLNNILQNYSVETHKKEAQIKWKFGLMISVCLLFFLVIFISIVWEELSFQKSFKELRSQIKL